MSPGAIEVRADGTLRLMPKRAQNPRGLEDALSLFADRAASSDLAPHYRLSAASVWRGRRQGLSLEKMVETLERHSGKDLPAKLRADLTRWSAQIDRLRLEVEQDRLILCGTHPLVITAVMGHRTLGHLVAEQLGPMRVELKAEAYPELIATFDACHYPVLDRVPREWTPPGVASDTGRHQARTRTSSPHVTSPLVPSGAWQRRFSTPLPCQAITTRGRRCKNRAIAPTPYCRVHGGRAHPARILPPAVFRERVRRAKLEALVDDGPLSPVHIARSRVAILMWLGLSTWLGFHLLRVSLLHGLGWALPSWLIALVSLVLSCGILGRLVVGLGVLSSLSTVGLYLLSIAFDCLHKEGLIVNLCYVVIPVLMPLWGLSQVGLSWAWVFACFPVGLLLGELLYTFLDAMST